MLVMTGELAFRLPLKSTVVVALAGIVLPAGTTIFVGFEFVLSAPSTAFQP